jgi:hypothetical protein
MFFFFKQAIFIFFIFKKKTKPYMLFSNIFV